jgi:hypothetical protein
LIEGGHEQTHEKSAAGSEESWLPWLKQVLAGTWSKSRASPKLFFGVRTPTRKYVQYGDGFEELYDLGADPFELENKADDAAYADDRDALRKIYVKLKTCVGNDCWVP